MYERNISNLMLGRVTEEQEIKINELVHSFCVKKYIYFLRT